MAMGMSYKEFWFGDVELAKYYRKAFKLKKEQMNEQLWLQGLYVYEVMRRLFPLYNALVEAKPEEYLKEPLPFTKERAEEQTKKAEEEEMENMRAYLMSMVARSKQGKGEAENA